MARASDLPSWLDDNEMRLSMTRNRSGTRTRIRSGYPPYRVPGGRGRFWSAVGVVVLVACIVGVIVLQVKADNAFRANCQQMGGHTITHDQTVTTFNGKRPGVGVVSTTYCLSPTGGILAIE